MKRTNYSLALLITLTACGQLDSIPYAPAQTPETWLQIQPYAQFKDVIFVQPSTSIIVYLLGIITIWVGFFFLRTRNGQRSRLWWGIALLLWGIGALLAGTSYEAFSYAIKCAGHDACLWTSWWEVLYLLVSGWSISVMLLAVSYSSTQGKLRTGIAVYAILNSVVYFILLLFGAFIPVKFLISFELLLVFAAPGVIAFFIINGRRYVKHKQPLDLLYLGTWIWLAVTIAAYFLYLISGNTAALWAKGIWFSENDVLHIFLIMWMLYIRFSLAPRVTDLST